MILNILSKLRVLLSPRDKQYLLFLLVFSIFISIIETIGISAIMPFIALASDFNLINSNNYYNYIYNLFGFSGEINFVMAFGVLLIFFYIFRSLINFVYFHLLARFSQGRYHLIAFRLFQNYLGFSYHNFIKKNSANLTKSIINEASHLTSLISAFLLMFSEVFVIIFIYSMMLFINIKITLLITLILGVNAIFLTKTVSKKIKKAGEKREKFQKKFYEIISSSFGNFKLIKLQSNEKKLLDKFGEASFGYAKTNITNITLSHFPRLFLEALGFSLIAFIIIFVVYKYQSDIKAVIPIISMFILGLYRLLPSVSRIIYSYNEIMFYHKALDVIHNDLMYDIEDLGDEKIDFSNKIELKNIYFEYDENRAILQNIDLVINRGEKIAFIGESGSGKSTLTDLIIGLYKPKSGEIFIDNLKLSDLNIKSWRQKIGYIPQSVYLFDGTVAENVVFGREFDEIKIIEALKKANIYEFLISKDGINTRVGDGGVMLSGGQKQRVAIARAIYGEPEILVLDEATSALDSDTESKIMDEIYLISSNKTLIIIAHRLSTIEKCQKVYKISNGAINCER